MFAFFAVLIIYFLLPSLPTLPHHLFHFPFVHHHLTMSSFTAAVDFICGPLASYITTNRARTAEAPRTGSITENYLPASEKSTSSPDSGSGIDYKYSGNYRQTGPNPLPGSLAISSFHSATAKSVDRIGSAKDFGPTDPTSLTDPDTKVQSDQSSGFFRSSRLKRPFAIPFVGGLQSKLFAVTGIGAFGGPKGTNPVEGQLSGEFILSTAENPASSRATGSSVLPCSIKPSCGSRSVNAAGLSALGCRVLRELTLCKLSLLRDLSYLRHFVPNSADLNFRPFLEPATQVIHPSPPRLSQSDIQLASPL